MCSESHFSVLFCLKKDLTSDWKAEKKFDLIYYDGLARQQHEIRLSIGMFNIFLRRKQKIRSVYYIPTHRLQIKKNIFTKTNTDDRASKVHKVQNCHKKLVFFCLF